jgi:hypothetical protein
MRNIGKIFLLLTALTLTFSCGKKGGLKYPGKQERPDFNGYSDEIEMPKKEVKKEGADARK